VLISQENNSTFDTETVDELSAWYDIPLMVCEKVIRSHLQVMLSSCFRPVTIWCRSD